uniref:Uncharacterized protein n=1 Tax=Ciona intestinalis TaxID=7719 RepID=F6ZFQ4_CIOIN
MTDTSSVASSVAKGEIAVANNPKGGVMIYVRSQPNSRSNSTAGTHESVESLNTSDNVQSLGSSEHGSQTNLSERKKSPRGSSKGKKIPKQSSPAKNGLSSRKATEENHKMSDGSYDGDQSRTEESILADKEQPATNGTNQVVEVDGEMVVVQEPQFDYYKWKPDQDVWKSPEYKKFVEIFNFPASMSDIEVTQHLSKYRGLRLARVDATHALCTLPSDVIAEELADQHFTAFETRPLCDASKQTKAKAKAKLENEKFEEVRAQRPKSSNAVAKRMIAGALGSSHRSSANKQSTKK